MREEVGGEGEGGGQGRIEGWEDQGRRVKEEGGGREREEGEGGLRVREEGGEVCFPHLYSDC